MIILKEMMETIMMYNIKRLKKILVKVKKLGFSILMEWLDSLILLIITHIHMKKNQENGIIKLLLSKISKNILMK